MVIWTLHYIINGEVVRGGFVHATSQSVCKLLIREHRRSSNGLASVPFDRESPALIHSKSSS